MMSLQPSKPKQKRAQKTRGKLIDAAIECLAKYGYHGTQLGLVADLAGVSRGPRQYYFPSRISLMAAVWEEIRVRDNQTFTDAMTNQDTLKERVDAILDWCIAYYKTHQYLADMELKLAVRSDQDLARILTPLIEQREKGIDAHWVEFLRESGKSDTELIADRYLAVSLMRGMAIEYLVRRDHAHLRPLEIQFKKIVSRAIIN